MFVGSGGRTVPANLTELRANVATARETHGRRSSQAERAFNDLIRAAAENGTPLDGLRHHVTDEVERFFSSTIQGPDGHVYWDGAQRFTLNDKKDMTPRRWWFKHRYGELDRYQDLTVKCGETNCINPEHLAIERTRGYRLQWTDERALAAFQVVCMRIGYTPTMGQWAKGGWSPSIFTLTNKFGGWGRLCQRGGVQAPKHSTYVRVDRSSVLDSLRMAKRILGHWPTRDEFTSLAQQLHDAALPSSPTTIRNVLKVGWRDAIDLAGRGKPSHEDTPTRKG